MKENSGEILRITGDVMQSIFTVKHSNECDPYVIEKFYQDEAICSRIRFGKNSYVVFYHEKPFGMFQHFFHQNNILIDYAIGSEFRGKKNGKEYLNFLYEYLSAIYQDSPYIVLFISPDNLPSIQVALKNGFYVDYGMDEENEMFGHTPYVKRNTYYKKDNQS